MSNHKSSWGRCQSAPSQNERSGDDTVKISADVGNGLGDDVERSEGEVEQLTAASLINNVRVYALTDYYNVPGLKDLAAAKFARAFDDWDGSGLIDVVGEVFRSTTRRDSQLRLNIAVEAAARCKSLASFDDFLEAAATVPDFMPFFVRQRENLLVAESTKMLFQSHKVEKDVRPERDRAEAALSEQTIALESTKQELDRSRDKAQQLQKDLEAAQDCTAALDAVRKELARAKAHAEVQSDYIVATESKIKEFRNYKDCRHCDEALSYPERFNNKLILRCGFCRTKHW